MVAVILDGQGAGVVAEEGRVGEFREVNVMEPGAGVVSLAGRSRRKAGGECLKGHC